MNKLIFLENIRCLRENEGLKQAEMPVTIGFNYKTWNNYERGVSFPKIEDLEKISHYFGILESDLIHTDISESDIRILYDRYISCQKQPFEIGNSPRSNDFKTYFQGDFKAIVGGQKPGFVTESVTNPVTNTTKNDKKGVSYSHDNEGKYTSIAAEPPAQYRTGGKGSETDEIAELKRVLLGMKALLSTLK